MLSTLSDGWKMTQVHVVITRGKWLNTCSSRSVRVIALSGKVIHIVSTGVVKQRPHPHIQM